ncbi:MAG: DUF302 domain-containing protein [Candidatus Eremiobacteraeota bacterium]|nr:DUF302 domain-containing protein [Candidatus Eremiobacteraeota bacterium]
MNAATQIGYGHVVEVSATFDEALAAVTKALEAEGFHIVSDIDMCQSADALGQEFRPYRILGACNAQLAHLALSAEPQLGLFLPCNVVVQDIDGRTIVSAINPTFIVQSASNRALKHIAEDANARLMRALSAVARQH